MGGLFIWDVTDVEKGRYSGVVTSCGKKKHSKKPKDLIWDLTLMLE